MEKKKFSITLEFESMDITFYHLCEDVNAAIKEAKKVAKKEKFEPNCKITIKECDNFFQTLTPATPLINQPYTTWTSVPNQYGTSISLLNEQEK